MNSEETNEFGICNPEKPSSQPTATKKDLVERVSFKL